MGRDVVRHNKSDGERDAQGEEKTNGPVSNKDDQSHNKPEGSISRNVQRVEAISVVHDAGTSHGGVEQPTITQAEQQ